MEDIKLVSIDGDLNDHEKKIMVDGMLAYHASKGHPRKTDTFSIVMRDSQNKFYGCVICTVLWNGMEIQTLWVDESQRNKGWGSKLMQAAENEATKRGCTLAYTNTFTWQAHEFYKKLGYVLYGELKDFPMGNSLYYFQKKLAA